MVAEWLVQLSRDIKAIPAQLSWIWAGAELGNMLGGSNNKGICWVALTIEEIQKQQDLHESHHGAKK